MTKTSFFNGVLLILIIMLTSIVGHAQSTSTTGTWQLLKSESGIKVFTKKIECNLSDAPNPYEYVLLKIENTTQSVKTITLNIADKFEEGCNGCNETEENATTITLSPNQSVEGECNGTISQLMRFIKNPSFAGSWRYINTSVKLTITTP